MTRRRYIIHRKLNRVALGQVTLSWIIAPPEQVPSPEVLYNAELYIVLGYRMAPRFTVKLLGRAIPNSV